MTEALPQYERIKRTILERIETGRLKPGDRIPSENELLRDMGVSRMTVNRALRELSQAGVLVRVQGTGTYVAERKAPVEILELRSIADQLQAAGQVHSQRLVKLETVAAAGGLAEEMHLTPGSRVFHSVVLHLGDGIPVQIEDRYVNPAIFPHYLETDFTRVTPYAALMGAAVLSEVEHIVEAALPDARARDLLALDDGEPCLILRRRTWTHDDVATVSRLTHPGNSQCFGTRFAYRA